MTRWPATCPQCGAPLMGMNCPRCKFRKRPENQVVYSASEIDEGGGGTGGGAPPVGTITPVTQFNWQSFDKSTTALSFAITTSNNDTVLVAVAHLTAGGETIGVTCDGVPMSLVQSIDDGGFATSQWILTGVTGGSPIVTVTPSVLNCVAAVAMIARGTSGSPVDQKVNSLGFDTVPTSESITTTQDSEMLFGAVGTQGPGSDTAGTWDDSFTDANRNGTTGGLPDENVTISIGYRILSAIGTHAASKTGITARNWEALIVSVKAA